MKWVDVFSSVFQEVIHGRISVVINCDFISTRPNFNPNQGNINVQWSVQLKRKKNILDGIPVHCVDMVLFWQDFFYQFKCTWS